MKKTKRPGAGFASMSKRRLHEVAGNGGRKAHELGTAHKWTSEEAQVAGRKGGSISRRRPKGTQQS